MAFKSFSANRHDQMKRAVGIDSQVAPVQTVSQETPMNTATKIALVAGAAFIVFRILK